MMDRFRWLAILSVLVLGACSENGPSESGAAGSAAAPGVESDRFAPVERVETQRVAPKAIHTSMAASGTVRARRVTQIGAEVSGRLVEILVDVGDEVEEGDPLFQIDPRP
jgi:multidrug efflux pump subunit AcrA (membrane-fusion protein)